jgi:hypothetical protein
VSYKIIIGWAETAINISSELTDFTS